MLVPRLEPGQRADVGTFAPREILVPYDFSEEAKKALPLVRFLAQTFDSRFTFFTVIEPAYPFFGEVGFASHEYVRRSVDDAPGHAEALFRELQQAELAGVDASLAIVQGNPMEEIGSQIGSLKPDLVVMATHDSNAFERLVAGSNTDTVVRHAPCSVLTTRRPDPA